MLTKTLFSSDMMFVDHLAEVFMQQVEHVQQQLVGVLLTVVVELRQDGAQDGPGLLRCADGAAAQPHVLQQAKEHNGHPALTPAGTRRAGSAGGHVLRGRGQLEDTCIGQKWLKNRFEVLCQFCVNLRVQEMFHQGNRGTETLQSSVQVAGVPRVVQSTDPGPPPSRPEAGSRPAAAFHFILRLIAAVGPAAKSDLFTRTRRGVGRLYRHS